MENKPKYSVLCLANKVTDDIILQIIKYICDGIKVILISNAEVNLQEKSREHSSVIELNSEKKDFWNKSIKNGLVGGITGLGGLITLPMTIPTDLVCS